MINIQIADFTKALMNDTNLIIILGRENFENVDFTKDLILIDSLTVAKNISATDSYNGTSEIQTFTTYFNQTFTLDFYGDNAYTNANKFVALLRSEKANWYLKDYNLSMLNANSIIDLKDLLGTDYTNRYQVEVSVNYFVDVAIDTLRIDSVEWSIDLVEE